MYRTSSGFPGILVVTGGTIDGELPAPDVEQWTGSKLSWLGETVEGEKCVGGWKPNH